MIALLEAFKALLWEDWDPIGVRGVGGPPDEYDGYAFTVWTLLKRGADSADIEAFLADAETGHIGLSFNSGRAGDVARKAVALKRAIDP